MIGKSISELNQELPKQVDVLRLYFSCSPKLPDGKKVSQIVRSIEKRYQENNIQIKSTETIRLKTKRLVKSCKDFIAKRKICRKPNPERERQIEFAKNLQSSFDVSKNTNGPCNPTNQDQSPPQSSGESDYNSLSEDNSIDSDHDPSSDPSDSDEDDDGDDDDDDDYVPDDDDYKQSKGKLPIPHSLLEQISKTKASYRICENLLKVGVQIPGGDPINYGLSKTSMWKQITQLRSNQTNEMLAALADSQCKVIIHFDGKTYKKLNKRHLGSEERIVVVCHNEHGDIALGLFAVDSKAAVNCVPPILEAIQKYNLRHRLVGLVCDTEAVNTGRWTGVCASIENALKMLLLHLMCRHHVLEVVLKEVFHEVFGVSRAPRIDTFDVLIANWEFIQQNHYMPIDHIKLQHPLIERLAGEAKQLIGKHAREHHFRNDYNELNDLVLKFLGIKTGKSFHVPGATSNARWMVRAIYAIKLYLFRSQIGLDPDFELCLERFCLFVSLTYVKYWNQARNAADAPFNDMSLLKEMDYYSQIDGPIAAAALNAFQRHLWYLSDELITLALFSDKVSHEEKFNMILMMIPIVSIRTQNSIKHVDPIDDFQNLELHQFISPRSRFLFQLLDIDNSFLSVDTADWNDNQEYRIAKKKIHDLIVVVNDCSERTLQLGANIIDNQRVQSDAKLQEFIISSFSK